MSCDCDPCLPLVICKKKGTYQISLSVTASPTTYSASGQVITFSSTVRNIGTLCLEGTLKICNTLSGTSCYDCVSIAPCCSKTFTTTYTITSSNASIPILLARSTAIFVISCKKTIRSCSSSFELFNTGYSLTGSTGARGPTGATGSTGATGPTGPTGEVGSGFMVAYSTSTSAGTDSYLNYTITETVPNSSFTFVYPNFVAGTGIGGYYKLDYFANQYMTPTTLSLAITGTAPSTIAPTSTTYDLYGNIPFSTVVYLTSGQDGTQVSYLSVQNTTETNSSLQSYINGSFTGYLILQKIGDYVPIP